MTYLIRILSSDPASYDMSMRCRLVDRTVCVCVCVCVCVECVWSVCVVCVECTHYLISICTHVSKSIGVVSHGSTL